MRGLPSRLLVVTELPSAPAAAEAAQRLLGTLERLFRGGARWVWFRERALGADSRRALAQDVARLVRSEGGILSIGADPTLAAELGAEGVHLPGGSTATDLANARRILPGGRIGVSVHTLAEVDAAARAGADYVTLSPIFSTPSKPGYGPALGPEALRRAAGFGLPVIALGGVTPDRVGACRAAGAAGIAVMGTLMRSRDPEAETRAYLARLDAAPDRD